MSDIGDGRCVVDHPPFVPEQRSTFCNIYDSSGSVWPTTAFPAGELIVRFDAAGLVSARNAWNLFERVEAHDAAVRVRLGTTGFLYTGQLHSCPSPSPWYRFPSNEERIMYLRGLSLHAELCQDYHWVPQRNRPITPPPVNVYPQPK